MGTKNNGEIVLPPQENFIINDIRNYTSQANDNDMQETFMLEESDGKGGFVSVGFKTGKPSKKAIIQKYVDVIVVNSNKGDRITKEQMRDVKCIIRAFFASCNVDYIIALGQKNKDALNNMLSEYVNDQLTDYGYKGAGVKLVVHEIQTHCKIVAKDRQYVSAPRTDYVNPGGNPYAYY